MKANALAIQAAGCGLPRAESRCYFECALFARQQHHIGRFSDATIAVVLGPTAGCWLAYLSVQAGMGVPAHYGLPMCFAVWGPSGYEHNEHILQLVSPGPLSNPRQIHGRAAYLRLEIPVALLFNYFKVVGFMSDHLAVIFAAPNWPF